MHQDAGNRPPGALQGCHCPSAHLLYLSGDPSLINISGGLALRCFNLRWEFGHAGWVRSRPLEQGSVSVAIQLLGYR